jgi:hypothetical protein
MCGALGEQHLEADGSAYQRDEHGRLRDPRAAWYRADVQIFRTGRRRRVRKALADFGKAPE